MMKKFLSLFTNIFKSPSNSKWNSFKKGFKHSWNNPMMPTSVLRFHNHVFIRIFRVLGGLSIMIVLSKNHTLLFFPLNYLVLILSFVHIFYILIIFIIKLIYGIKQFFDGSLDVKNSPLDRYATIIGQLLHCWKIGCTVGQGGISLAGASIVVDTLLEASGQEKIFTPLLGKGVKFLIGGKSADTYHIAFQEKIKNMESTRKRLTEIRSLQESLDSTIEDTGVSMFSKEDIKIMRNTLNGLIETEETDLQKQVKDLRKNIKDHYDEKTKK